MSQDVLVVEDYPDLRSAIVETLARRDYTCETANSAEDAIRKLSGRRYETILLSTRLPIKDDPVMQFLHDVQPGEVSKVILMKDPEVEDHDDTCRVLFKPFNNEQLFRKLAE